jgi:hypothetical protein
MCQHRRNNECHAHGTGIEILRTALKCDRDLHPPEGGSAQKHLATPTTMKDETMSRLEFRYLGVTEEQ